MSAGSSSAASSDGGATTVAGGASSNAGSGGSVSLVGGAASAESGVSGDVEYRYERAYAAKLDPFSRFRKEERRKRYDNLNPADKAILLGGKFFMSNRYTRAFLFAYIIFLHITMFLTLHHSIHSHHLAHVKCATSSGAAAGAFPKIK